MCLGFSWATLEPERDVADEGTGRLVRCEALVMHRVEAEGFRMALLVLGRGTRLAFCIAPQVELVGRGTVADVEGHRPS